MKLVIVGCSGSSPGPTSPASCYLVEHDGFRLLLDLGNGAFGALQALVDPDSVDAVFLTHLHADHCLDIAPFVVWRRYSGRAAKEPLPLYAPVGAERRLAMAYDIDGDALTDVFDFVPVGPGAFEVGPFAVEIVRTVHPIECYAIRLTVDGRSMVYTGDTGPSEAVIALARDTDVLLAEAAHPPGPGFPPNLHLTGREAAEHAAAAGAKRLLLTHVPPWVDAIGQLLSASAVFPETELVRQGATYEI